MHEERGEADAGPERAKAPPKPQSTPMMRQWEECKKSAGSALLLFRMGDFYEAFYEDAEVLARALELTLTKRQGIPMAGVPWHASEGYIDRLISMGYRVAIAEQQEEAKEAKKLVHREVVRVVTPGSATANIAEKSNNFFASLSCLGGRFGLSLLDLTTSEFRATELDTARALLDELCRIRPAEILVPSPLLKKESELFAEIQQSLTVMVTDREPWHFHPETARLALTRHFGLASLDGLGFKGMEAALSAAGALLTHITDELCVTLRHIQRLLPYTSDQFLQIDRTTQRALELTETLFNETGRLTLLSVVDKTQTPMGGRLLCQWLRRPLLCADKIRARQDAVESLIKHALQHAELEELLRSVRDLERLIMRVCSGNASPRDLASLGHSLEQLPLLRSACLGCHCPRLKQLACEIDEETKTPALLLAAIADTPPLRLSDGGAIRDGFNDELDQLRALSKNHKQWIAEHQEALRGQLGIKTLRVGYTRVFGYYIEVSKGQAHRMPESFHRRQTLANAERFVSPELKEYEAKVLSAEERILALEQRLFKEVLEQVASQAKAIMRSARAVAIIDCLQSLAKLARTRGYVRPEVDEGSALQIEGGRHPVVEQSHSGGKFVPNDTALNDAACRMMLITGPNMAGKSTYIRQVAMLVIMAQIGSFLPVRSARIGIIDKLFTRIGASDDLARGQSTFMVEMTETANILNNASARSLIILDEIGRGTSTYDGVSIAWAVAEYLLTEKNQGAKVLFATHYLELTELEKRLKGVKNYNVAVKEQGGEVIFLHHIERGCANQAYGIHVAKLAGMPRDVTDRAEELLKALKPSGVHPSPAPKPKVKQATKQIDGQESQLTLFEASRAL